MLLANGLIGPSIPWTDFLPLLILLGGACFLLLAGSLVPNWPRHGYAWFTGATATAALVADCVQWNNLQREVGRSIIADAIFVDRFSVLASITVLGAVIFSSVLMTAYLQRSHEDGPELFALFLTSAIGAIVMISANDLIVMFLGLEVLSLSLYLLAASNRRREQSQESGIKYFILGGFASAFFLYGIALV
jgi:NADH-quinone oxidoreductase subunit N